MIDRGTNIRSALKARQRGFLLNPFRFSSSSNFPPIADDNSSFNDEGTSTTGWTTSNATVSSSSSVLRKTKTVSSGTSSSISKTITFTPTNRDWILFGKVKVSNGSNNIGVIWFLNGSKEAAIWLGSAAANTVYTDNAVSLVGTTGASTRNVQSAGSFDFSADFYEFAIQFDSKFACLTLWQREAAGTWAYRARVACDWFAPASNLIQVLMTSNAPNTSWIEFDYLTLCQPNIVAIGDSVCAGATLFNPNPSAGLSNDASTWMRYAAIYTSRRNNLIVNKGVGSQSSTTITARIADATGESPRVVFLHASSNDEGLAVSQATRTANIDSAVTSIGAAGAETVLLNAMYGTDAGADNTPTNDLRDYMLDWWVNYRSTLTPLPYLSIDIMQPILSSGFMDPALTQSDGIHPTAAGYQAIGEYIKTF